VRDAGVLATRLLRRLLRPLGIWQKLVFFEKDLADDIPDVRTSLPLEMRVVDPRDVDEYRTCVEAAGVDWAKVEERAALGHRCTVALSAGRLVHIRWITTSAGWVPELRCSIVPGPGEAYVYDAFTPEHARGGGVQPAVACLMMAWGRRQGYRRHIFYVRGHNAAGLRVVSKMRARRMRVVRCLRLRSGADWVQGLRSPSGPRLEFPAEAIVRSLGPLGAWVTRRAP
jgi:hypothetical protein